MVWQVQVRDFKMQYYQGKLVLSWWEGKVVAGHGIGKYVIFDCSYCGGRPGSAATVTGGTCTSSSSPLRTPRS